MLGTFIQRFVWTALELCAGRGYGHTGDATQDCVRLPYAILLKLHGPEVMRALSRAMHLNGFPLGSFDNCKALVDAGLGWYETGPAPGGIFYCQGWNGDKGHCFVVIFLPGRVSGCWILEATNSNADRDDDGVPDRYDWFRPVNWAEQASRYEDLMVVQLRDPIYI